MAMADVDVDVAAGARTLRCQVSGEGEPLVVINGLGAGRSALSPQLEAFGRRFTTLVPDHRGTGGSSDVHGDGYTLADLADDVVLCMGAVGVAAAHVLGISMGGAVAQHLALRHPGTVRRL